MTEQIEIEPIRKQVARKICAEAQVNLDTLPKFYQDRNLKTADQILALPSGLPNLSVAALLELVKEGRVVILGKGVFISPDENYGSSF